MIFTNKKDDELIVTCNCSCGYGLHWAAGSFDEEGEEYYLTLVEMSWYAKQGSRLKSYFKRLWKALRGKENVNVPIWLLIDRNPPILSLQTQRGLG
jgi:hypothetical protein